MLKFSYNVITGMSYWFEPTAQLKQKEMKIKQKKYKQ